MKINCRSMVAVGVALATLLLASACSTSNSYDASKVEAQVVALQKGKLQGLAEGKATCPSGLKLTEGMTFTCTLEIAGTPAPFTVTLTNVKKDPLHIDVKPAKTILSTAILADQLRGKLPVDERAATVVCGPPTARIIVAVPGQTIECTLKLGAKTGSDQLTVQKDGTVDVTK
jgi:hypothetical protein